MRRRIPRDLPAPVLYGVGVAQRGIEYGNPHFCAFVNGNVVGACTCGLPQQVVVELMLCMSKLRRMMPSGVLPGLCEILLRSSLLRPA